MQYLISQDSENRLSRIRCFALDMDGTVYLGSRWVGGAREFLRWIEETGRRFCFSTNNSSKDARCYFEKLADMGLPIQSQQLVTSGHAAVAYLKKHHPGKKIFLLDNPQLCREFISLGISLEEDHPDLVATAFDTSLTYTKMCRVCDLVRAGLPYLSIHLDLNCPTETGFAPDSGTIHAFIRASARRWPGEIIGKPNCAIIDFTLGQTGSLPKGTAMVDDRLYTDIAAGVNSGLTGILVLNGEAALKDIDGSGVHPDPIFDSVKEIIPLLQAARKGTLCLTSSCCGLPSSTRMAL